MLIARLTRYTLFFISACEAELEEAVARYKEVETTKSALNQELGALEKKRAEASVRTLPPSPSLTITVLMSSTVVVVESENMSD